jgi:hypothetical protein
MLNPFLHRAEEGREFLQHLWHLENADRPGFIIGDLGGAVLGGEAAHHCLRLFELRAPTPRKQMPTK